MLDTGWDMFNFSWVIVESEIIRNSQWTKDTLNRILKTFCANIYIYLPNISARINFCGAYQVLIESFPSLWSVAILTVKTPFCPAIYTSLDGKYMDAYLYQGYLLCVKCKQSWPGFELDFLWLLFYYLPPITKTIQVRRTRHAGHCWWNRDEHISDVPLLTLTYGRVKAGWPAQTYIQQLCEDTGCSPEDLPEAMNDREKWRERVRDNRANGTWWWWWWWWWWCWWLFYYL